MKPPRPVMRLLDSSEGFFLFFWRGTEALLPPCEVGVASGVGGWAERVDRHLGWGGRESDGRGRSADPSPSQLGRLEVGNHRFCADWPAGEGRPVVYWDSLASYGYFCGISLGWRSWEDSQGLVVSGWLLLFSGTIRLTVIRYVSSWLLLGWVGSHSRFVWLSVNGCSLRGYACWRWGIHWFGCYNTP